MEHPANAILNWANPGIFAGWLNRSFIMVNLVSVPSTFSPIGAGTTQAPIPTTIAVAGPASSPACAPLHPARPPGNLLSLTVHYCGSSVPQLHPCPDLSYLPDADKGIFINSDITASGQAMLRQSRDLAVHLEIHGHSCRDSAEPMTPELLQKLLADTLSSSEAARRQLAQTNFQMSQLVEVATLAFNDFLVAAPSAVLRTELDADTLRALAVAGLDSTGCSDPGRLYQALCARLLAIERQAMRFSLQCLRFDLQVQRLRLLCSGSKFLSAQALRVLNDEFGDSDELPGMHLSEIRLNACAANPFDAEWPTPALGREESKVLNRWLVAR